MSLDFQRARRPEHKEERRAQLLEVATDFLTAGGALHELGLNELARRAGMAKSNVYRYFESREALLLELLERAFRACFERLREKASSEAPLALERFTELFADALADEPLLGQLTSALPSVLEHNLSKEAIRTFKLGGLEFFRESAEAFQSLCPRLSVSQHLELLSHTLILITGLWPHAHPAQAVLELVQEPELAPFAHDYPRDLDRALRLYAKGLLSEAG